MKQAWVNCKVAVKLWGLNAFAPVETFVPSIVSDEAGIGKLQSCAVPPRLRKAQSASIADSIEL